MTKRVLTMLVKLQTMEYLIYAELDKTERVTDLAIKNRIHTWTCCAILHEIERAAILKLHGVLLLMDVLTLFGFPEQVDCERHQ